MKRLSTIAAVGFLCAQPALASTVTDGHLKLTANQGEPSIISVTGKIVRGDSDSFRRLASHAGDNVIVVMNSPGGLLMEGLSIGEEIKNRHYSTVADTMCGSACAYAWLAGDKRGMIKGSVVIFHSPSKDDDEGHADGTGNVIVGQYMAEIGIDLNTSITISGHGPDDYYSIASATINPIIPFTEIDIGAPQQAQPQVAQRQHQEPREVPAPRQYGRSLPHALVMECFPIGGKPYAVVYNNGIAATIAANGVTRPYSVIDEKDDRAKHVMYLAVGRADQDRTLYFAFDYSQAGRDVSAIRVKGNNGSDARDKCEMDWDNTK